MPCTHDGSALCGHHPHSHASGDPGPVLTRCAAVSLCALRKCGCATWKRAWKRWSERGPGGNCWRAALNHESGVAVPERCPGSCP